MVTQTNYYDALGRRYEVSQQAGSGNSTLGYVDDGSNVALAYNGSTSIGSLLGLGLDELFQLNFNGTLQSSVLKDPLGSVVGLTGSSKTITDRYQYEPYGASTHTSGTSLNNYQFAGQANDFNNLYFMRNRYYLPAIGRFISRDPSGLGGGTNMYAYAGDDPVNFSDPTGSGVRSDRWRQLRHLRRHVWRLGRDGWRRRCRWGFCRGHGLNRPWERRVRCASRMGPRRSSQL